MFGPRLSKFAGSHEERRAQWRPAYRDVVIVNEDGWSEAIPISFAPTRVIGFARAQPILVPSIRHYAAAAFAADFTAAGSAHAPKPTARRFQLLMTLITNVSLTCSASLK
jgi:hypothetical protein